MGASYMKTGRARRMCIAGAFAALVFVFTAYLHIPSHTGYTHVGDGLIYLAACLLPLPYAAFVGVSGALLADCLTGYALWAPASVVIKGISVLFFTRKSKKVIVWRNLAALLPASVVCIGGYYLYDALITGNLIAPLSGIPGYVTQSVLSSLLFVVVGLTMDKWNWKQMIYGGNFL